MTSVVRLYVVALATVVLFLGWAFAAARPFGDSSPDPRMEALAAREQHLRAESVRVQRLVDRRWAAYGRRMAERSRAPQPVVRLTQLPPVTATRSS